MELAKKYCGMEMFLAAPLDLLLEFVHFTAAKACELTAIDIINTKANLIIGYSCFPTDYIQVVHELSVQWLTRLMVNAIILR